MTVLSKLADATTVDRVVVFVADSLRYDHLPDAVRERGLTARTVSASTFTASSIPSMMTGTYPSTHKVWNFDDAIASPPALFHGANRGLTTQNVWNNLPPERRPPLRTLRLREETTLEDVEGADSSLVVVHDRGAHGPYDYTNVEWEDSGRFFTDHANDRDELRALYERGCESAGERFLELVADGDPSTTLFVFTSDHGELLGEYERGGVFGHGSPICPELVSVPTVFVGAGLPAGEELDVLLSGTDLAPTLLGAQNRDVPSHVEGVNCWNDTPSEGRVIRSEMWSREGSLTYGASSVWDRGGGVVHHHGSGLSRVAFGYHRKIVAGSQAPAIRSLSPTRNWNLIRTFGRREATYGTPENPNIRDHLVESFTAGDTDYDVEKPDAEQLEALGYIK
jgi:hypothetical protein